MNPLQGFIKVIRTRPFYIVRHFRETLLFFCNYFIVRLIKTKNVFIGRNFHSMSPFSFCAELPNSSIFIDDNCVSGIGVKLFTFGNGRITVGKYCSIGDRTQLYCRQGVSIGNYVLISWDVQLFDYDAHSVSMKQRIMEIEYSIDSLYPRFGNNISSQKFESDFKTRPIVIEDGVWIGSNVIILKGTTIGRGSIVGAGAVVSGTFPSGSIIAGNPAKVIRKIDD